MFLHDCLNMNKEGHLTIGGIDTTLLAKEYGTPLYVMDEATIRNACRVYKKAMIKYYGEDSYPLFASKALSFKGIYRIMSEEGMGVDVVSPGELYTAKSAGFPMERVYFHGNNKTDADLRLAVDYSCGCIVVDNIEELESLDTIAGEKGIVQKIQLRITPGIDPHTHKAIVTGNIDSKFGSAIATGQAINIVKLAISKKNLRLSGLHCHIGSQIFESDPFEDAARLMLAFIAEIKNTLSYEIEELNFGGGFGVRYIEEHPEIDYEANIAKVSGYVDKYCAEYGIKHPNVLMEPGRSIVAAAGITLYTVGSVKEIPGFKNYVSVDGGMPDNPRYALYQSQYTALIANKADAPRDYNCTIAGRCCESGDLIAENTNIQKCTKGDILAVLVTGAYNYSMASNYNRIPRPPVVMVKDGNSYVAVKRESYEDLIRNDL